MDYKHKLEELILTVIHEGGSDLHLGAGRVPVIRVSGELIFLVKHPVLTKEDMIGVLGEVLEKTKVGKFMENQEADFSYDFRGEARLRGNAFFQKGLMCLVFRLVPKVRTIKELHLPVILSDLARKKQGFFLVVGPVGQGKSTTLSAMIDLINNEQARNIITIEDPIEHVYIPNKSIINQREVGIDTKDFHVALKSVFREDVNVIMIGEMRTPETIATAVTAAETGHLVLSTLHTNNNAVSNLIREKHTHEIDVVIETGSESGMIDLNHSLIDLVRAGEISIENAYQYSLNPKGLERMI